MTIRILQPFGTSGLTILEAPASIEALSWEGVSDTFKEAFLEQWKNAYEWEQYEANGGINQLSVLDDLAKRLNEGTLDTSLSFAEAYKEEIKNYLS